MTRECTISACQGRAITVARGRDISVIDTEGGRAAGFSVENADDPGRFVPPCVTVGCNDP